MLLINFLVSAIFFRELVAIEVVWKCVTVC